MRGREGKQDNEERRGEEKDQHGLKEGQNASSS